MNMFTIFAHAGHAHESTDMMTAIDRCMPILIGAGIITAILVGVIVYLLTTWQPKKNTPTAKK